MKLLHIDSSILAAGSVSRILSAEVVGRIRAKQPDVEVVYRDLADGAIGHLSGAHLAAAQGAVPEAPALRADLGAGQDALAEFIAADVVVVGAPMYNFGISSQLKAWIDRLAVAGKTFRYGEKGAEGLMGGKKVVIASSRGGFYGQGTPAAFLDHQEAFLKGVFGFFGITDVEVVRAEGVAMGPEARAKAIDGARHEIEKMAA